MAVITLVFGSFLGMLCALFAWTLLGAGLGSAALIYFAMALGPLTLSIAAQAWSLSQAGRWTV